MAKNCDISPYLRRPLRSFTEAQIDAGHCDNPDLVLNRALALVAQTGQTMVVVRKAGGTYEIISERFFNSLPAVAAPRVYAWARRPDDPQKSEEDAA